MKQDEQMIIDKTVIYNNNKIKEIQKKKQFGHQLSIHYPFYYIANFVREDKRCINVRKNSTLKRVHKP